MQKKAMKKAIDPKELKSIIFYIERSGCSKNQLSRYKEACTKNAVPNTENLTQSGVIFSKKKRNSMKWII